MRITARLIIATVAAIALAAPAFAADTNPPTKAPPQPVPFVYPSGDGWYGIVGSEGGGGTASVSAPGVNANSLVTNSASIYLGLGYQWSIPKSPAFSAVEAKVGYTNLNGSAPGLSFQGPIDFHVRWLIGVPLDQISKFFVNPFGIQMPTTAPLPAGVTAVSQRFYMAPGFHVSDDSLSFMGKKSNAVWGFAPSFAPAGLQVSLSNGGLIDAYTEVRVNMDGLCSNTTFGRACGRANTEVMAGLDYKFGVGLPK
jgi:hypothetical protein